MAIRLLFFILSISIIPTAMATSAKIYVWTNEEGVLVFSDSPRPGAEEIVVDESKANVVESSVDTSVLDITPKEIKNDYTIEITQPTDNATIRDNTGSVHVTGRIKPVFKRGMTVQLYLNNIPYNKPQTNSKFAIRNVDRGEHQIKMEIIDQAGKVIASSNAITFYMHRASAGN